MHDNLTGHRPALGALEILEFCGRHIRALMAAGIIGGVLFGLVSFLTRVTFTSTAVIAPDTQGLLTGQLAGLASEFGVGLPGGGGSVPPELFVAMLRSDQLLLTVVDTRFHSIADSTLTDRKRSSGWTFPGLTPPTPGELAKNATLDLLDNLQVSSDPQTGAVELDISASSPELAHEIASRALDILDSLGVMSKQRQGGLERRFFDSRLQEASESLKVASTRVASFLVQNRAIQNSPWLQFELDQLQRAVTSEQALYESLRQSYEHARLDAVLSVPDFLMIQVPSMPVKRDSRHTVIKGLAGGIFGIFVVGGWLLLLEWWQFVVITEPGRAQAIRQLYSRRKRSAVPPS
ncbi:MAG: hypothetical protein WBC97_00380 [Gemmatimonadales bacterium]